MNINNMIKTKNKTQINTQDKIPLFKNKQIQSKMSNKKRKRHNSSRSI